MAKKLTEQEYEKILTGGEPTFNDSILEKTTLIQSLNWYSSNRDSKNAKKYINDYLKKNKITSTDNRIDTMPNTFGWLCRMLSRGAKLSPKDMIYFTDKIDFLKHKEKKAKKEVIKQTVSIRDRIEEKARECIGELEGCIDEYVHSSFKKSSSPLGVMIEKNMKSVHCIFIVKHFKDIRDDLEFVSKSTNPQLIEGYSNLKKSGIKKLIDYIQSIIDDTQKLIGESKKTRKPRKRKVKTAEQLVGKIKYCKEDKKLGIKSIDPQKIIGAQSLWVYNIKTRKVGCYYADDVSGFGFKGTSVLNYSESKSIAKTVRKPDQVISKIPTEGKVFLRNLIGNIKAKEIKLNGRINADTVLLRVL
jgi:ElaB/YqjD/DUF883 family membrane-anchored ribosome-binding protein